MQHFLIMARRTQDLVYEIEAHSRDAALDIAAELDNDEWDVVDSDVEVIDATTE